MRKKNIMQTYEKSTLGFCFYSSMGICRLISYHRQKRNAVKKMRKRKTIH